MSIKNWFKKKKVLDDSIKGNFIQLVSIKDNSYFNPPVLIPDIFDKFFVENLVQNDNFSMNSKLYRVGYFDISSGKLYNANALCQPIYLASKSDCISKIKKEVENDCCKQSTAST